MTASAALASVELHLPAKEHDLGGFPVRRALPTAKRRSAGPFVFVDQMGPARWGAHRSSDVRPHPHIGLSTLTYLFEGAMMHRDSLGTEQEIVAGEVNWMTAGRGIVHSERAPERVRGEGAVVCGMQVWVALPVRDEERAPSFEHHDREALPRFEREGVHHTLLAGEGLGARSPVRAFSPLFYFACETTHGGVVTLPDEPAYDARALYVLRGEARTEGPDAQVYREGSLLFFSRGVARAVLGPDARVMLLGGESLPEPRYLDWNFVSSSRERLARARAEWEAQRFDKIPGDDQEFIPLPR